MNVYKNARLTPRGRERIVRQVDSGDPLLSNVYLHYGASG